jgi:hypothetical protein
MRAPFERQRPGNHVDAGLCGTHMGLACHGDDRLRSGNVDDRGAGAAQHRPGSGHHMMGPEHVDFEHGAKAVRGDVVGARQEIARRAGDQNIDVAERVMGLSHDTCHGCGVAHIRRRAGGLGAAVLQPRHRVCNLVGGARHDEHAGTGAGEALGDTEIDAARPSRHEHRFPGIVEHSAVPPLPIAALMAIVDQLAGSVDPRRLRSRLRSAWPSGGSWPALGSQARLRRLLPP